MIEMTGMFGFVVFSNILRRQLKGSSRIQYNRNGYSRHTIVPAGFLLAEGCTGADRR
jgi:hypothetical protein